MSDTRIELASDYDSLLKQARAMKIMIHALEQQKQFQNISISSMTRQIALSGQHELDAERQTNHLLTEELEQLQSRLEAAQARVRELEQSRYQDIEAAHYNGQYAAGCPAPSTSAARVYIEGVKALTNQEKGDDIN